MSTVTAAQAVASGRPVPGDGGAPIVGNTLAALRDPLGLTRRYYERYGPVFWTRVFGIRIVALVGPQANEAVLRNPGGAFSNALGWDYFIGRFFRRGVMLLDGDEHRQHRGIMQAAFRKQALAGYLARMNPEIERSLAAWGEDRDFHVLPHAKQLTLDLATRSFMGEAPGPETAGVTRAFIDAVRAGTAVLRFALPGGRWKKGLDGRRYLEAYFRERLPVHRAGSDDDLFSQLCHARDADGRQFSDEDVINHMIFLMLAAHDTTTITLCSVLYQLARHPEWQERLRQEARGLGKPVLEPGDLERTPLMGMVMKEALRLMPPVPGLPRRVLHDTELLGYHLPQGSYVMIDIQYTHLLEPYWSAPTQFDPERFGEARNEHRNHAFQFVPFGGGAHTCIGMHFAEMQVKAILHPLLLRYRWTVPADYRMPVDHTALPVPKDGLPVRLERR